MVEYLRISDRVLSDGLAKSMVYLLEKRGIADPSVMSFVALKREGGKYKVWFIYGSEATLELRSEARLRAREIIDSAGWLEQHYGPVNVEVSEVDWDDVVRENGRQLTELMLEATVSDVPLKPPW